MATLFSNGKIRTLGASGIVNALLCDASGRIVAAGDAALHHPLAPGASTIDLRGRTALPGPVDAHVHLLWNARNDLYQVDLGGCRSLDELQERLRAKALAQPTGWLLGAGFDHELFPTHAMPTREDLDAVAPDRPAIISRLCYHVAVANTKALQIAGVESETGILTEDRMDPVYAAIPEPGPEDRLRIARRAVDLAARAGFTGCHVIVDGPEDLRTLQTLWRHHDLKVRLRIQCRYAMLEALAGAGICSGFGDEWLSIGGIKMFADGAMGPRTAALSEEYADDPGNIGELIYEPKHLAAMVAEVHQAGFQAVIHAIGDKGLDVAIDAIVHGAGTEARAARHRIEHASIVRPDQIHRLARHGIVCCVQPQFVVTDFWTAQRMGAARKTWIYPFQSMLSAGVPMAGGTDCPVERLSAMEAIGRAATRNAPWRGDDISQGYLADECLTVEQAWRLYTEGSAYSGFAEESRGTLEPGMACDFIALDEDPFTADLKAIETMEPALTVVGGRVAYAAQQ